MQLLNLPSSLTWKEKYLLRKKLNFWGNCMLYVSYVYELKKSWSSWLGQKSTFSWLFVHGHLLHSRLAIMFYQIWADYYFEILENE